MEGNPCRNGLFESCSFCAFPWQMLYILEMFGEEWAGFWGHVCWKREREGRLKGNLSAPDPGAPDVPGVLEDEMWKSVGVPSALPHTEPLWLLHIRPYGSFPLPGHLVLWRRRKGGRENP